MKKVLTIGGATQDIFIHPDNIEITTLHKNSIEKSYIILQEGTKIEVTKIDYSTGGGATNSAVSFKRLGFDVASVIKLGNDKAAHAVLDMLKNEGIYLDHIITSNIGSTNIIGSTNTVGSTGISYIIPTPSGDRTILAYRGINAQMKREDIPWQAIKNYDFLYITSLSGSSSALLPTITQEAKKHGIPVATNPGTSQLAAGADTLRESLPNIDILILNADEAKLLMASLVQTTTYFSWEQFFTEVLRRGPRIAVVTNGAEGVYVATQKSIFFYPSLKVKIVNTLGAGDAFGSCFVASILSGNSIQQALINGIINASSVISYLDAKEGLLDQKTLEKRSKAVDLNLLQIFPL